MRKLVAILILIFIIGCSKKDTPKDTGNSIDNSAFHIFSNVPDTIIYGESGNGYFTITSLNNKSSNFKVFVTLNDDKASLLINGTAYKNGEVVSNVKEGKTNFILQNASIGALDAQLKIIDEFKNTLIINKTINIVPELFTFSINPNYSNIDLSQIGSLQLNITNDKHVTGNVYTLTFSGRGSITYNNKVYLSGDAGIAFSQPGNYTLIYKPLQKGVDSLKFMLTDNYKRSTSQSLGFTVYNSEFDVSAISVPSPTLSGSAAPIALTVNTHNVFGIKYQAKVIGNGVVTFNNNAISTNQYFDLPQNSLMSYTLSFMPANPTGTISTTIMVKNQLGTEKAVPLDLVYKNGQLQTTITTSGPYSINESIFLLLTVIPSPESANNNISATFKLKQGVIKTVNDINGNTAIPLSIGYNKVYLKLDPVLSKPVVDELTVTITKPNYDMSTVTKSLDLTK